MAEVILNSYDNKLSEDHSNNNYLSAYESITMRINIRDSVMVSSSGLQMRRPRKGVKDIHPLTTA
jgi:hypothetical protein